MAYGFYVPTISLLWDNYPNGRRSAYAVGTTFSKEQGLMRSWHISSLNGVNKHHKSDCSRETPKLEPQAEAMEP